MFASLGGIRIVSLELLVPFYGAVSGIIALDVPTLLTGPQTLVVADITLSVFSYRTQPYAGRQPFMVVGGFGGWRKPIVAQAYAFPGSSVTSQTVLSDVAGIVGEQVVVASPVNLGPYYFREGGQMVGGVLVNGVPASRQLKVLAGDTWWVDPSGVTQVGPRTKTTPITSSFELIDFDAAQGRATIATENPSDWQPGRTFTSPVLGTTKTVCSSAMSFGSSGSLRLEVLTQ